MQAFNFSTLLYKTEVDMNEEDTMFSSMNENLYSVTKSRSSFSSSSNSDYQLNNNSPQIKSWK